MSQDLKTSARCFGFSFVGTHRQRGERKELRQKFKDMRQCGIDKDMNEKRDKG